MKGPGLKEIRDVNPDGPQLTGEVNHDDRVIVAAVSTFS